MMRPMPLRFFHNSGYAIFNQILLLVMIFPNNLTGVGGNGGGISIRNLILGWLPFGDLRCSKPKIVIHQERS